MLVHVRAGLAPLLVGFSCVVASCSHSGETILDCTTAEQGMRDIIRIRPDDKTAEHITLSPTRAGSVETTGGEYLVHFNGVPPGYELRLRINRVTGEGTREFLDPAGKTIEFQVLMCKPYQGKPL